MIVLLWATSLISQSCINLLLIDWTRAVMELVLNQTLTLLFLSKAHISMASQKELLLKSVIALIVHL